jgi:NADPH2:quinone reductase
MKAIIITGPGAPDAMTLSDVPDPTCPADTVRVRVEAAGVNFIDTYERSGVYKVDYPFTPGREGAGTIIGAGADVTWAQEGDRVAWAFTPGSYAEQVILHQADVFAVPDGVPSDIAAAAMMQALTAHYLCTSSFELRPGHTALVHAGAGGVGLLLTQMAVARGARVITTVSSDDKAALSRAAGADVVVRYDQFADIARELPDAVRSATGGRGVDVVYDGVGKTTFDASLSSLAVRGVLVLFGGASGQVPAFDLQRLNAGGSLSISRPTLKHFIATAEERTWRSGDIFGAIADGTLDVRIGARFPLADAADAHVALEGRATTGKVLLIP